MCNCNSNDPDDFCDDYIGKPGYFIVDEKCQNCARFGEYEKNA